MAGARDRVTGADAPSTPGFVRGARRYQGKGVPKTPLQLSAGGWLRGRVFSFSGAMDAMPTWENKDVGVKEGSPALASVWDPRSPSGTVPTPLSALCQPRVPSLRLARAPSLAPRSYPALGVLRSRGVPREVAEELSFKFSGRRGRF